jgi:O-antigen ligase
MWNYEFRESIDMNFAFSAHNQFLQSLAGAGLVGVISLIVYLSFLLTYSIRSAKRTKGLTLALFAMMFMRCITETPLELGTILNGDFLIHLMLFQTIAIIESETYVHSTNIYIETGHYAA